MPDIFSSRSNETSNKDHPTVGKIHTNLSHRGRTGEGNRSPMIDIADGTDIHSLPGHSHSPLASYCFYPDNIGFANADANEKILLLLRRHPITNFPWVCMAFLLVVAPSVFSLLPLFASISPGYQITFTLIWYMVTMAYVLEKFLHWFFNVDIVTDERIIDISFYNLMYREITEAGADEIQEVTVRPAGGVMSFFEFGDVVIQTAAETPRVIFTNVPQPEKVAKVLRELQIQEETEKLEGRIR